MRLSTVILPTSSGAEGLALWKQAEDLGLHAAYTYDQLSWRSFREDTWHATMPLLAAAAVTTSRIKLGTLVASPNFRHPVTFAKELMTLDDLSDGRFIAGLGAGSLGFDATVLGQQPWSTKERTERFLEMVEQLDTLLTQPATSFTGTYYSAVEARMIPGCIQQPRVPFFIAATGPKSLDLVARHGQGWITYGDPAADDVPLAPAVIAGQIERLAAACAAHDRDPATVTKVLLVQDAAPLASVAAFEDWAGGFTALGIDELVIPWPIADSIYGWDPDVFEAIAETFALQPVERVVQHPGT